jgi:16S rRNA (cytosine1402-N4)-methyltransferase
VLADLGVSSLQIDDEERGFGMRSDAPLDMRMSDQGETALQLIQRLSEEELADIIYQYGEERLSRNIAPALQAAVAAGKNSAKELAQTIRSVVRGHQKRHPALRTFQALRIAVNDELGQLEVLLSSMPGLLQPGGVGVIISFHSLEDRLVKNSFRSHLRTRNKPDLVYSSISKKVVTATADELTENNRAHSAKLRWAKRVEETSACA